MQAMQATAHLYLIYTAPTQIPAPKYFKLLGSLEPASALYFPYIESIQLLKSILTRCAPRFRSTEVPEKGDPGDHPLGETRTWRLPVLRYRCAALRHHAYISASAFKLLTAACRSVEVSETWI